MAVSRIWPMVVYFHFKLVFSCFIIFILYNLLLFSLHSVKWFEFPQWLYLDLSKKSKFGGAVMQVRSDNSIFFFLPNKEQSTVD